MLLVVSDFAGAAAPTHSPFWQSRSPGPAARRDIAFGGWAPINLKSPAPIYRAPNSRHASRNHWSTGQAVWMDVLQLAPSMKRCA